MMRRIIGSKNARWSMERSTVGVPRVDFAQTQLLVFAVAEA